MPFCWGPQSAKLVRTNQFQVKSTTIGTRQKFVTLMVFADDYMRLLDQLWQKAESGALHNAGMLHNLCVQSHFILSR